MENGTTWFGIPAIGVVIGLVELAKSLGLPVKYAGLLGVAIGVAGGIASYLFVDSTAAANIALGLLAGLSASGLYSSVKNAREG